MRRRQDADPSIVKLNERERAGIIYKRLVEELNTDRKVNKQTLAREFGCSPKTVQRDIENLDTYFPGVLVEWDPSQQTYYLADHDGKAIRETQKPVYISNYDLFVLLTTTHLLSRHRESPVFRKLEESINKLASQLPNSPGQITYEALRNALSANEDPIRRVDPKVFDTVKDGIERSAVLEMTYKPLHGRRSKRRIHPLLLDNTRGDLYVIAWCEKREAIRIFALSRVKEITKTADAFSLDEHARERAQLELYLKDRFGIFMGEQGKKYAVKLRFSRDQAPYVKERVWHADEQQKDLSDGSVELSFTTNHLFEVSRWVLSWGSGVKVLGPRELKEEIKRQLEEALKQYR